MGSTDSLGTLATSKDLESICSGSSVLGLPGSGPSPRVGLNKENSSFLEAIRIESFVGSLMNKKTLRRRLQSAKRI